MTQSSTNQLRRRISFAVGGVALIVIVGLFANRHRSDGTQSNGATAAPVADWAVSPERAADLTARLLKSASKQWEAVGVPTADIPALEDSSREVLASIWTDDFDRYLRLTGECGAHIGQDAEPIVANLRTFSFPNVPTSEWGTSPGEGLRYAWLHPARRGAKWKRIGEAKAGAGWYLSAEDSKKGTVGQIAIIAPPELYQLIAGSQNGTVPAAWIQMPVSFDDGCACEVRITFLRSPKSQRWVPVRIESIGGPCPAVLLL